MSAISSESARPSHGFTADDIIKVMSTPRLVLDVYSHGIRISKFGAEVRALLIDLCRTEWADYSMVRVGRRFERKISRVFVGTNRDRSVFHIHRNQLDYLLNRLSKINITADRVQINHQTLYAPESVVHPLEDTRPPREAQIPIINYVIAPPDPAWAPSKVVTLQTGGGKTYLALNALRRIGVRTAIILKGMYIDKWIPDIEEAYGAEKGSLMVIRGVPQLRSAIEMAKKGTFHPRVVIISNKTMFMYLQYYEKHGVDDYLSVSPMDLYKHFGVGVRLIDEVHQEFHCNFRQDLYTHVPLTLSLSATLDPDSPFKEKMYKINWPEGTWAPTIAHDCFIAVKALWYRFRNLVGIRYMNAMRQYSHGEFEKSILKHPQVLANYVEMITDIVDTAYIAVREPGQKMIVFVASIQLATILTTQLQSLHPRLNVNRYVEDDEYDSLLSADISVSTLLSAGTAVDIPNLRITLMTTALSDKQANLQVLGRTRRLKDWPEVTPEFYFLAAKDIDKHCTYAKDKRVKFEGKVKSFQDLQTNYVV